MNAIISCQKKAYKQIRQIQNAKNMLEVGDAMFHAILETFGVANLGLIKYAMDKGYTQVLETYGAHKYTSFDVCKYVRNNNLKMHRNEVRQYLISFIPERMKKCAMYREMIAA